MGKRIGMAAILAAMWIASVTVGTLAASELGPTIFRDAANTATVAETTDSGVIVYGDVDASEGDQDVHLGKLVISGASDRGGVWSDSLTTGMAAAHVPATGQALFDFIAHPVDGTSNSTIRFNRFTTTTGNVDVIWYKGDGLGTQAASLDKNGNYTLAGDLTVSGGDINSGGGAVTFGGITNHTAQLNLTGVAGAGQIMFTGTHGGANEGVGYEDSGGNERYGLSFPGSNIVRLSNTAADGVVSIAANTSTAGAGGQVLVVEVHDTGVLIKNGHIDMEDDTDGYLRVPNLTTTERNALTAEAGMIIYNVTTGQHEGYDGAWNALY